MFLQEILHKLEISKMNSSDKNYSKIFQKNNYRFPKNHNERFIVLFKLKYITKKELATNLGLNTRLYNSIKHL
jgi:hypothetical protein